MCGGSGILPVLDMDVRREKVVVRWGRRCACLSHQDPVFHGAIPLVRIYPCRRQEVLLEVHSGLVQS